MTLSAQQFAFVSERFVEALGTCLAVLAGISFITIALSVALSRAIAFAGTVARAIRAWQAFLAEVVWRAADFEGVDAEPLEEI